MSDDGQGRRLSAIVVADIAGYCQLTESDEKGTHAALMSQRNEIVRPGLARHGGRLVKSTGDGFLCEFDSVTAATQFAYEFQVELVRRNAELPPARRLEYRIGVNVGDVMHDERDIYGESVNTAVRLEQTAPPNGIRISADVYAAVKNKVPIQFRDRGPKQLRSLSMLVHVFEAVVGPVPHRRPFEKTRAWLKSPATVLGIVSILLGSGWGWSQLNHYHDLASDAVPTMAQSQSIAILPFEDLFPDATGRGAQSFIRDEISARLSKISDIYVLDQKPDEAELRENGRFQYLLDGSILRVDENYHVSARLTDNRTGRSVWAGQYDGNYANGYSALDRISTDVVSSIAVTLGLQQPKPTDRHDDATRVSDAYDAFLWGWDYFQRQTPEDFRKAIKHLNRAVALKPDFSKAYAALGAVYTVTRLRSWHKRIGLRSYYEAQDLAWKNLKKAMRDPSDVALRNIAKMLYLERRFDAAIDRAKEAVAMAPNEPENIATLAMAHFWSGDAEAAVSTMRSAMQLDPHFPPRYQVYLGLGLFAQNRFEEAAVSLKRMSRHDVHFSLAIVHLVATLGYLGKSEEAKRLIGSHNQWRQAAGLKPVTIATVRIALPYRKESDLNRLLVGLRMAGMAEGELRRTADTSPDLRAFDD